MCNPRPSLPKLRAEELDAAQPFRGRAGTSHGARASSARTRLARRVTAAGPIAPVNLNPRVSQALLAAVSRTCGLL